MILRGTNQHENSFVLFEEALRLLRRRLSDVVYRALLAATPKWSRVVRADMIIEFFWRRELHKRLYTHRTLDLK